MTARPTTPADWIDAHVRDKALPPPPVNPDHGSVPIESEEAPVEADIPQERDEGETT